MAAFDGSPRPNKRRKTNLQETSSLTLPGRALRAVKQAVFGKSPSRSSPTSRDGSGSTDRATSARFINRRDSPIHEEVVDWDIPDSNNEGSDIQAKSGTPTNPVKPKQSTGIEPRTLRGHNGRTKRSQLGPSEGNSSLGDGHEIQVTSTKIVKRPTTSAKRTYKAHRTSQESDELGDNNKQDVVYASGKVIQCGATSKRRQKAKGMIDHGRPIESDDGNDLLSSSGDTDASLDQPRVERLYQPKIGYSSAKQRHKPRIPSVESDRFIKVAGTPTTRSGRKRGFSEVAKSPVAPADKTPITPSSRKRGRPPKQPTAASIAQREQNDDLGFKKIPSRHGSISRSPEQASNEIETSPIEELISPAGAGATLKTKQKGTGVRENNSPAAETAANNSHLENMLDTTLQDDSISYIKELENALKKDSTGSLAILKTQLMVNVTGKCRLPLVNLEAEYQKVHQLVEQTVLAGEGNSMLVIGSRGTGKTVLVETVIGELAMDHREKFHVVRLNGFVHTDDKLALREIWRQLGREMEVEDDTGDRCNYADTLTSLLALLSHSADVPDTEQEQIAKSVIFVIDEFDLFASHPRQTLLYNLFDVAQSRNAPVAVLGLTTKVDVVESLEKRVKSRFGQRYVYLSLPKTYTTFQDICKSALTYQHSTMFTRLTKEDKTYQRLHNIWAKYVNALFTNDRAFDLFLFKIYTRTRSVPSFLTACLLPISFLSPSSIPTGPDFANQTLSPPDSKLHVLPGLSNLELSLLIAAARLDIILDTDLCNFSMAYDEYQQLASRVKAQSSAAGQTAVGSGARVWGREIASRAWEHLANLELILPALGGSAKYDMGRADGRMWRVDVGLEEIGPSVSGMNGVMSKWCREI